MPSIMGGMKTKNLTPHPLALAVLTAQPQEQMAVLSADLSTIEDGWVQLLPAGEFKARDGRPHGVAGGHWYLDQTKAEAFIAATKASAPKVLIDYDHQTMHTEKNGQLSIAAAWIDTATGIEWREGKGIYVQPDWTDKAQAHIDAKELAYLSAVFPYSKDGTPLYLRMAAITNDPGLVGMESVAALAADIDIRISKPGASINLYGSTEESVLNDALKKLLARLGITVDGELTDELATAALTAVDALQAKADKVDSLEQQVAVLSAQGKETDLTKFVPVETYNAIVGELAVLKAGTDTASIESVIKDAKADGKIVEAEVGYLTQFGEQQGVAALKAMLEPRPAIAALKATQTSTTKVDTSKQEKSNELNEAELAVLKACDLDKEDFKKAKERS